MKTTLFAVAATMAALSSQAHAYTIDQYDRSAALPATVAPSATASSGAYDQAVTTSSRVRTSPFKGTSYAGRAFDAVEANGSATFSVASFGQSSGALGTFAFVFGSPDSYNTLKFTLGGETVLSLTGSDFGATTRNGYYLARVSDIGAYDSVTFGTGSYNGFEFAAISPVPLPASAPMFGAALLALGALGYGIKRKTAAAAA